MSVLIDTSIWIDHLNRGDSDLVKLLEQGLALVHPFIIGELACGRIRNRDEVIDHLLGLPTVAKADDHEVLHFITSGKLHGRGLGLIDVHLLAACRLNHCQLWTRDKRLLAAAEALQVATQNIA